MIAVSLNTYTILCIFAGIASGSLATILVRFAYLEGERRRND